MGIDVQPGEEIVFEGHPSWRSTLLFYLKGFVLAVIAGAIVFFAVSDLAGILVAAGGIALTVLVGFVRRIATVYAITTERLYIRHGIVARKVQECRLTRVQDVTIDQGVFERLMRIGRAKFDTASDSQNDFIFEGIESPDRIRGAVDRAHRAHERGELTDSSGGLSPIR